MRLSTGFIMLGVGIGLMGLTCKAFADGSNGPSISVYHRGSETTHIQLSHTAVSGGISNGTARVYQGHRNPNRRVRLTLPTDGSPILPIVKLGPPSKPLSIEQSEWAGTRVPVARVRLTNPDDDFDDN